MASLVCRSPARRGSRRRCQRCCRAGRARTAGRGTADMQDGGEVRVPVHRRGRCADSRSRQGRRRRCGDHSCAAPQGRGIGADCGSTSPRRSVNCKAIQGQQLFPWTFVSISQLGGMDTSLADVDPVLLSGCDPRTDGRGRLTRRVKHLPCGAHCNSTSDGPRHALPDIPTSFRGSPLVISSGLEITTYGRSVFGFRPFGSGSGSRQ